MMSLRTPANLRGLRIVSFESRRAREMAELIRRYGGDAVVAPSLREVPLGENRAALQLLPDLEAGKFDWLILTTGVGTRTLHQVLLTRYPPERIVAALKRTRLVARGPKPIAALKEMGLTPTMTIPEPNTWRELLAGFDAGVAIRGKDIALQEYGAPNPELVAGLGQRGAVVRTIPIYRWGLPEDVAPLRAAIQKIVRGDADAVLFTNGAQVDNLIRVAGEDEADKKLRAACRKIVIGSVGPLCTQALQQYGLTPDIEPAHPRMGSLVAELAALAHPILLKKRAAHP